LAQFPESDYVVFLGILPLPSSSSPWATAASRPSGGLVVVTVVVTVVIVGELGRRRDLVQRTRMSYRHSLLGTTASRSLTRVIV